MQKVNILQAYPYINKGTAELFAANQSKIDVLVDSGAFTAWKSGQTIHLDDYCKFLDGLPFKPWRYFTLDVIGNPAATMSNYKEMLKRGYSPIPIFTRGEDFDVIDELYETSDIIGVGGLVHTSGSKAFVNSVMRKIGKRKTHLLGFCRQEYLLAHRPYSCDSCTWMNPMMFGNTLKIYFGNFKYINYSSKEARVRPPSREIQNILREKYQLDYRRLQSKNEWRNTSGKQDTMLQAITAKQITWYMDDLAALGVKYFAATSGKDQVNRLINESENWRKNK